MSRNSPAPFRDRIRYGAAVTGDRARARRRHVSDSLGHTEIYDQVVVAAHSDQALAMLQDASADERAVLGAIKYRPNAVYLHRDPRLMPKRKRAWAAWNFLRGNGRGEAGGDVAITYWMNALQGIDPACPLFVSLNPPFEPKPELTFARFNCDHPQFDRAAFAAQKRLDDIQGCNRTWFCGAWTGYGFHEDGLRSGLAVADRLGRRHCLGAGAAAFCGSRRMTKRPDAMPEAAATLYRGDVMHARLKPCRSSLCLPCSQSSDRPRPARGSQPAIASVRREPERALFLP